MNITIPMRLRSTANLRMHWAVKSKMNAEQRHIAKLAVIGAMQIKRKSFNPPIRIILTRYGVRCLDDDNLQSAFKAVRDGVADALGIDDGSKLLKWQYEQEKAKTYSIQIEIAELNGVVTANV